MFICKLSKLENSPPARDKKIREIFGIGVGVFVGVGWVGR